VGLDKAVRMRLGPLVVATHWNFRAYASAEELLARYPKESGPGCLLADVGASGVDFAALQQRLSEAEVCLPVIITRQDPALDAVVEAFRKGAYDYLDDTYPDDRLLEVLRGALAWDRDNRAVQQARAEVAARAARLTVREREVMRRVIDGATCKQIALERGVSSQAIDAHRKRVLRKMQARNVPELVRLAVAGGLISPTAPAAATTLQISTLSGGRDTRSNA
jgi:two-component system response regulator FixJ